MAAPGTPDIAKKLTALQLAFKQQLPGKISEIKCLWEALVPDAMKTAALEDMHRMAHSLVGSAGTFGAMPVSIVARDLEKIFKSLLHETNLPSSISSVLQQEVDELLIQLGQASDNWQPSTVPFIKPNEAKEVRNGNLLYLAEDDELLAKDIVMKLEQADYQVQHFVDLANFEKAFEKEMPAAILMDVVFKEGNVAGADVISRLNTKEKPCPPVIFISVRDDIEVRLAAARAGARRYLCKPLDMEKLTQTLNGLTAREAIKPFRILYIDDDEILLEYYATILREAGMEVETLSAPLEGLALLHKFKPDVVILDVYMPGCSGPELAQVIRQDDAWAMMPIVFLSTERDLSHQLAAMDLGGDDFLEKPVEAGHLVSAVTARAKRARWTTRLNKDLDNVLRENRFQLATMDQHDLVSTTDITGRITSVNEKFCDISGYSREELLGQNHRILKSGYHSASFYDDLWSTISQGKVWRGTVCNRKKNGDEYWVESTIVPFLDDRGKPYKYVSARTDITSTRRNAERLHRSQAFANIGTWDWNITTGDLYWSDRIAPLFGYRDTVPDTTYENFLAAVHPDDQQMVIDAVNGCVEQGAEYNIEHRVVWDDGSEHWLSERGNVIRADDGTPLHMLGVVRDIDARKRAELVLAESQRQLIEAQTLAHVGSWQADLVSGELTWSDEIYRIFGHEPGSFAPSVEAFHAAVHPDDLERVHASEKQAEQTGNHDVVHRIVKPDGTVNHVHELAKAETDAAGNLIRLTGTVQDITEQVEAKQNLIDAREEAENANHAKSQFLSSMSHELRTPMNAIMGFGQLLKMEDDPPLTESQVENVDEIVKASNHLLELINEVLDLAKIEAGRIDLSIEAVAIGEVIAESVQLIMPLAQKRGIETILTQKGVDVTFDQFLLQDNIVRADRTRLRQVLLNLLSNAIKYNCENGKLTIACHHTENSQVRIAITDTGDGIALEQQGQLFEAFNRLGANQSDIEGTGIGLVITKNIIELMGGNIGVNSQPGVGSTFWIELPADTLQSTQHDASDDNGAASTSSASSRSEYEHTVLYIEDNPANLRLVTQLLGRMDNIHMWSAHEPMLGLELAAEHKPNLILLDVNLPGMDGFGVLKHLRQREATRNTPVIAISANAMPKDIEKGMKAGFDDYFTKPIDVATLLKAVKSRLVDG